MDATELRERINTLECQLYNRNYASGVLLSVKDNFANMRSVAELTQELSSLKAQEFSMIQAHQPKADPVLQGIRDQIDANRTAAQDAITDDPLARFAREMGLDYD